MSDHRTVLVTGATGRQGGATVRALVARGRQVHALVRDPDLPAARALRALGATPVAGDLDDPASLEAAMRGVHGVFSVQPMPAPGPEGCETEVRRGKAVADAAARTGVAHFVYTSVDGAGRPGDVPHFRSKGRIEQHVAQLGLPATVLRPAFFLTNFTDMGPRWAGGELVLSLALAPHTALQLIHPDDIGEIAADVFDAPAEYLGRTLEIAGDRLTGPQMAEAFARAAGRPVRFRSQPVEEVRAYSEEMAVMFEWFDTTGFLADVPALRAARPHLATLDDWAAKEWTVPTEPARPS
ncbi:NmrA/HSCARG family protein [Streptomyces sp. NPDC004244]|uniref:NmrA/HSCARG family protein n=1 Tax=Streptomyces sp. NPDC101206 TaxID=3366128 RepID=UPI00382AD29A